MPDPTVINWHPTLHGDIAGAVPDLMDNTNSLVERFLDANKTYADTAITQANTALTALARATMPPTLPDPPPAPTITTSANLGSSSLGIAQPDLGNLDAHDVAPFVGDTITIPDITDELPTYVPVITGLTIPEAPIFSVPTAPTAPGINTDFSIPDAPIADYGLPPSLFELNLPTYDAPTLPVFNDAAPEFATLPPSPFIQWTEPVYSSAVKDAVASVLATMLAGGTGLPSAVELALWERARERELTGANKVIAESIAQWASRGYSHPPGQLNAQTLLVQEEAHRKSNELSREVMVEQAKLEQQNRQFAVEKGISYEQVFVGLYGQIVDRNFQIAKFTVETQIQIYNMQIAAFNVAQAVFAQKIERYRVQLEATFVSLKVFQALVDAEKAKSEINTALIESYKARIQAFGQQVEAFKAVIMGATAKADLEKNKVELYKAQIEGQVAEIGVQRGAFEAYSARVGAESAKAGLEESNARVFASKVQGFATKAEIGFKGAETQMQSSRLKLDYSVANLNRVTALQDEQLKVIQANLAGYQAATSRAVAQFGANSSLAQLQSTQTIELSRLSIAKYSALLEQWKTRANEILAMAQINAESLRAAGQIASNLASGAMAGTHVSAGVSAGANSSQTRSDQKSEQMSFNQHQNDNSSYSININRKGADVA